MYAVIKTGGKQYRVQAGDLIVIEKLAGEPGAKVAFEEVLMIGEGEAVTLGVPLIEGASVSGTLVETRKGDKIKVFKKIRRQGYRRTRGHRQIETVLRVTGIDGAGQSEVWAGEVDLTPAPRAERLRARNLARGPMDAAKAKADARAAFEAEAVEPPAEAADKPAKPAQGEGRAPRQGQEGRPRPSARPPAEGPRGQGGAGQASRQGQGAAPCCKAKPADKA